MALKAAVMYDDFEMAEEARALMSTPTLKKLRRLAHEWGLACFCDGGAEGGDAVADYFSTHPSASWPAPWLPQSSERFTQLRDWGINE